MTDAHKISLSVQYASNAKQLPTRSQFRRWVKVALEQDVQIALRIVDEIEGACVEPELPRQGLRDKCAYFCL